MEDIQILNYQGNKHSLMPFIKKTIDEIANEGDTIVDIFAGGGSVSNGLSDNYRLISNDSEPYSSLITDALINTPSAEKIHSSLNELTEEFNLVLFKKLNKLTDMEQKLILANDNVRLIKFYENLPTVWNNSVTPHQLRKNNDYNLFQFYYAGTYFGLKQSMEIDSLIYSIKQQPQNMKSVLMSALFSAIMKSSFSKDGHLAQPLNPSKNAIRHIHQRKKDIFKLFENKIKEFTTKDNNKKAKNIVYNSDFRDLMNEKILKYKPSVIYADPPYTDMQYSRYYHILNVAESYNYPELTKYRGGYTKGLYTEGRNQSVLSKKSTAFSNLKVLMRFSHDNDIKLVLSYAFPVNIEKQNTDRYTVTIDKLIMTARKIFGEDFVDIRRENYKHANNRNSTTKKVYEYLIICGERKKILQQEFDIRRLRKNLRNLVPTSRNPIYNSHLYWSQKSFNVIDSLIDGLSNEGDIIFDPFMGSGVVPLEAVKNDLKRNAVGSDVNELPIFIVKTLLNDSFFDLEEELENLLDKMVKIETKYYSITCPNCNANAMINKVIFDKPSRTNNKDVVIKSIDYECPNCKRRTVKANSSDYKKMFNENYQIYNIQNERLLPDSKLAVGKEDYLKYLFTPRNYKVLDEIIGVIKKSKYPNVENYLLMSVLHLSKITDMHSNSQWPLWIPKINCVEKNITKIFIKKIKSFRKTIAFIKKNYTKDSLVNNFKEISNQKVKLFHKGSQFITNKDIPNNSIDLIITDPPYMGQVAYSEYLQLYEPIVGLKTNFQDEIIVSSSPERKNKDADDYFKLLNDVFKMCSLKLKENRFLAMFYHDSNLSTWGRLINILEKNGFSFVCQEHINKKKTVKNILSPKKSLNGDAILIFNNKKMDLSIKNSDSLEHIESSMFTLAKYLLESGPKTTHQLYDGGMMSIMIENQWIETFARKYPTIVEFLEGHFIWEKESSMWYLPKNNR